MDLQEGHNTWIKDQEQLIVTSTVVSPEALPGTAGSLGSIPAFGPQWSQQTSYGHLCSLLNLASPHSHTGDLNPKPGGLA